MDNMQGSTCTSAGHNLSCHWFGFIATEVSGKEMSDDSGQKYLVSPRLFASRDLPRADLPSAFNSSNNWARKASKILASPDGFYPPLFLPLPTLLSFHPPWCWQSRSAGYHEGSNLMSRGIKRILECGMIPGAPSLDSPLFRAPRCPSFQAKDQKPSCPLSLSCHLGPACSWAEGQDVIYLLIAQGSFAPAPIPGSFQDPRGCQSSSAADTMPWALLSVNHTGQKGKAEG